jgi:hypothetical protein
VAEDLAQWQPLFEWLAGSSRSRRAGRTTA